LAALEVDLEKLRGERDGAMAKVAEAEAAADEAKKRSAAQEADLEKARSERDESAARAEAVERAREAEVTATHASRRELALNGIVAFVFVAALLLLLIYRG